MTSWTRVRTHDKNSGETVRRLGTIIQSIFCAQSGASIRLIVLKWSGESRYTRALPPVLENFSSGSPGPTDCPWVSEDVLADGSRQIKFSIIGKAFAHVAVSGLQTLSERVYPET